MEALYDRTGRVYAWAQLDSGRIYSLLGKNLAFIHGDSVYNWRGAHIGWWHRDHIRDNAGAVALFLSDARALGVMKPMRAMAPMKPVCAMVPMMPMRSMQPMRPMKRMAWSSKIPFVAIGARRNSTIRRGKTISTRFMTAPAASAWAGSRGESSSPGTSTM